MSTRLLESVLGLADVHFITVRRYPPGERAEGPLFAIALVGNSRDKSQAQERVGTGLTLEAAMADLASRIVAHARREARLATRHLLLIESELSAATQPEANAGERPDDERDAKPE